MDRRRFVVSAASLSGLSVFHALLAQQSSAARHVGFLYYGSRESAVSSRRYDAFIAGMRDQGYVLGKHFILDERFDPSGDPQTLTAAAQDLVRLKVNVIVATGYPAARAAQKATSDLPIVVTATADPVRDGFAVSLVRPGRNITGLYSSSQELVSQQIELFQLLVPKLSRVAVLWNPANASHETSMKMAKSAAQKIGVAIEAEEIRTQENISHAFDDMSRKRAQALLVLADTFFLSQARRISELGANHHLPTMAWTREFAVAGALMSYGQDSLDMFRLSAGYVDKIFKGANPADLPFSRSSKISLTVNRRTLKALGLTLSKELESRFDEVIE